MPRKHWTLVVVPDDDSGVKQLRFSRRIVRVGTMAVAVVLLGLVALSAGFFVRESHRLEAERLARANALLQEEIDGIRLQLDQLDATLTRLSENDEKYRLLAGLEGFDDDVRQAGIGGPGTETLQTTELWRVDEQLGTLAFETTENLNTLLRRARLLESSWSEATSSLQEQNARWAATPSILPTMGDIEDITSDYSQNRLHPILHVRRPHKGIDIVAPRGAPVFAAAKGRVTFVGSNGDFGWMVELDHGFGLKTRYAHISRNVPVRVGQIVERGEKVAEVGETGLVTNPSLHYEVLLNGRPQNPRDFILGDVLPF